MHLAKWAWYQLLDAWDGTPLWVWPLLWSIAAILALSLTVCR